MKPHFFTSVSAVLRKDLMVEMRTLESVPAMALFAVSTLVVFHFAFSRDTFTGSLAAGVLWVTLLFAAAIGINRLFVAELEQARFDGLLLTPMDRTALFVAKATAFVIYMFVLEIVVVPAFALFFFPSGIGPLLLPMLAILALANVGLACAGCFAAALTIRTRARELLMPIILMPLTVPLIIAASSASSPLFALGGTGTIQAKWLLVLALFDTVLALLAFAVFDYLLEE